MTLSLLDAGLPGTGSPGSQTRPSFKTQSGARVKTQTYVRTEVYLGLQSILVVLAQINEQENVSSILRRLHTVHPCLIVEKNELWNELLL